MNKVLFINLNGEIPEYKKEYLGFFILSNSKLYIGTDDGWKELTNSDISGDTDLTESIKEIIGELNNLTTTNKKTIVSSINELNEIVGKMPTIDDSSVVSSKTWSSDKVNTEFNKKQDVLTEGKDIKIENNIISVEEEWNISIFDTNEFNKGYLTVTTPDGYIFDNIYVLCHWYGKASSVASNIFGGFYQGTVNDANKQLLRNSGSNKMGAGYFTANIVNMDNNSAISYGECYLYNSDGSITSLNNPINSYGIGRYSHVNDFKYFTIHNFPGQITEGYCCIKYKLKKQ